MLFICLQLATDEKGDEAEEFFKSRIDLAYSDAYLPEMMVKGILHKSKSSAVIVQLVFH